MSEKQSQAIQENIIDAAARLLKYGLVARTWGNLSQRINRETFYCTPSGRDYTALKAEDMVLCNVDGTWEGDLKPTTERSLHALIYQERVDADFVIHTHQPYASALSVGTAHYPVPAELAAKIGSEVLPIAEYGLPGQKKLHNAIMDALRETGSRAILMRAHGMVVFGRSSEEALALALEVEAFCKAEFAKRATLQPEENAQPQIWYSDAADAPQKVLDIFAKREDINVILGDADPVVLSHNPKLLPFLDDFAQIVGVKMTTTPFANAVFAEDAVYYLGRDLDEAQAIRMVVHKNAITATVARSYAAKPLSLLDRILMNAVFKLKYSKLKDKK